MSTAKSREEYATEWKNQVSALLYGPVADVFTNKNLTTKMRDTITVLCGQIDEVGEILEKEGTFKG